MASDNGFVTTKQYLLTSEVAALLGCTKQYVGKLIAQGKLSSHQLGDRGWHRIPIRSVRQYALAERIPLDFEALDYEDSTS